MSKDRPGMQSVTKYQTRNSSLLGTQGLTTHTHTHLTNSSSLLYIYSFYQTNQNRSSSQSDNLRIGP